MIDKIKNLIKEGKSQRQIAKILEINLNKLRKVMKDNDIKTKNKPKPRYNIKDLIGNKYGRLVVDSFSHKDDNNRSFYNCSCDCGNSTVVRIDLLISGNNKSCGCLRKESSIMKAKNMRKFVNPETNIKKSIKFIGSKFNKLTIVDVENNEDSSNISYICKCDCGNITKQRISDLKSGKIISCGCYQKEQASKTGSTVGLNNYKSKYKWYFIKENKEIKCRSGYEVIYANYLIINNIPFEYEPKTFKLANGKRYTPDFYLFNTNEYIEIKGSFKSNDIYNQFKKIEEFKTYYNLSVLFWGDLFVLCELPFKSYSNYMKKAKKNGVSVEFYLSNKLYLEHIRNDEK